jgi:hypothetical protein
VLQDAGGLGRQEEYEHPGEKGAQPGWCDPGRAGCTNPDTPPSVPLDP